MPASQLQLIFRPGRGRAPYLAGREKELKKLEGKCLRFLLAGDSPPADAVLIGPRGNGKTALLGEFARRCRKAGADVVRRTPNKLRTEEDLAIWLLEADPKRRGAMREEEEDADWPAPLDALAEFAVKAWGKSARIRKSAIPGLLSSHFKGLDEKTRATIVRHTDLLLEYAARWRPRVAILDEAHTLDPNLACLLLNTAQNVDSEDAPFLLVLAGTPQLERTLKDANASFWERCEEIGVGRLSAEATREALERPLAKYGVSFDPAALDAIVEDSQRYPYFIQMWGAALCRALPEGASRIGAETVEAARAEVDREKSTFYGRRYMELFDEGLIPAAEALARAFARCASLDIPSAAEIAGDSRKPLERLGYIWRPTGKAAYEPGIPSQTAYVLAVGAGAASARRSRSAGAA